MIDTNFTEDEKKWADRNGWIFEPDPLSEITPEVWEVAKPKLPDNLNCGSPMIFGTAEPSNHWIYEAAKNHHPILKVEWLTKD